MPKNKNMLEIAVLYNDLFCGWCLWLLVLQSCKGRSWCHCSHMELAQPNTVRGNQPFSFLKMFNMNRSDKKEEMSVSLIISINISIFLPNTVTFRAHFTPSFDIVTTVCSVAAQVLPALLGRSGIPKQICISVSGHKPFFSPSKCYTTYHI